MSLIKLHPTRKHSLPSVHLKICALIVKALIANDEKWLLIHPAADMMEIPLSPTELYFYHNLRGFI